MDLAEGIALRGGVNLDRLQSLLRQEENSTAEALSPYAHNAHSRFLPELSLGIKPDSEFTSNGRIGHIYCPVSLLGLYSCRYVLLILTCYTSYS